ncbi:MAG: DinB family protein [Bacteroidetes bacterium]|nr:DinB family protein [Bacteroidota bacterium]
MFRQLSDFFDVWKHEREATAKVFSALTDNVLKEKKNHNLRSLGRLAGHIIETLREMPSRAGLNIEYHDEVLRYNNVKDILTNYKQACDELESAISAHWNDSMLTKEVELYGEKWKIGQVLFTIITHQAHHRAQMTVLMRLVGLTLPGIYGPSKEEWAAIGMPAME